MERALPVVRQPVRQKFVRTAARILPPVLGTAWLQSRRAPPARSTHIDERSRRALAPMPGIQDMPGWQRWLGVTTEHALELDLAQFLAEYPGDAPDACPRLVDGREPTLDAFSSKDLFHLRRLDGTVCMAELATIALAYTQAEMEDLVRRAFDAGFIQF